MADDAGRINQVLSETAFLYGGKVLLEAGARGIGHARILVTFVLADRFLNVSGCRENRNRNRAGGWVRFLSDVNGTGGKAAVGICVLAH